MARNYGDVTAEFRALLTGCGIYDLRGRTKVVLTGSDRVRWLNGMTTNNVRDLAVGHEGRLRQESVLAARHRTKTVER